MPDENGPVLAVGNHAAFLVPHLKIVSQDQGHDARLIGHGNLVFDFFITDRFGSRTKTFILYAEGADKMLIEFTNPEERGQKIMRLEDEIYLYFPDAEEVIRLQGSALKESVMGSDFSYEDMTGEGDLLDQYEVTLLGEQMVDGRRHYHLELEAKKRGLWNDWRRSPSTTTRTTTARRSTSTTRSTGRRWYRPT